MTDILLWTILPPSILAAWIFCAATSVRLADLSSSNKDGLSAGNRQGILWYSALFAPITLVVTVMFYVIIKFKRSNNAFFVAFRNYVSPNAVRTQREEDAAYALVDQSAEFYLMLDPGNNHAVWQGDVEEIRRLSDNNALLLTVAKEKYKEARKTIPWHKAHDRFESQIKKYTELQAITGEEVKKIYVPRWAGSAGVDAPDTSLF